jgi:hypothetical protein
LKTSSTTTVQPSFAFEAPSPDLKSSLEGLQMMLSLFLTSEGLDPKTISGTAENQRYTSGLERLLAMLDQFEATQDDFDLFYCVEKNVFELIRAWNNELQGTDYLKPELVGPTISDSVKCNVQFYSPEVIQTQSEKEDSVIKRFKEGFISFVEGVMELRGVTEAEATAISEKLKKEKEQRVLEMQVALDQTEKEEEPIDGQDQGDTESQ